MTFDINDEVFEEHLKEIKEQRDRQEICDTEWNFYDGILFTLQMAKERYASGIPDFSDLLKLAIKERS